MYQPSSLNLSLFETCFFQRLVILIANQAGSHIELVEHLRKKELFYYRQKLSMFVQSMQIR